MKSTVESDELLTSYIARLEWLEDLEKGRTLGFTARLKQWHFRIERRLTKHMVIMFEKRNFQEHQPLLTTECFALEAPVMPVQPTSLTGDTGLTDVTNRSLGSGSANDTGLTDAHDRSDRFPGKIHPRFFMTKNEVEDWRKAQVDYLHNPSSSVDRKV
jgi:hypothetical protein